MNYCFRNFRQGDRHAAAAGLVAMSAVNLILIMLYKAGNTRSAKNRFIRFLAAAALNALLIITLMEIHQIPSGRLLRAVANGNAGDVKRILESYPIIEGSGYSDSYLMTDDLEHACNKAVERAEWDIIDQLLHYGLDLNNFCSPYQDNALEHAVYTGSLPAYKKLISLGCIPDNWNHLLGLAMPWSPYYNYDLLEYLLKQGLDPDNPLDDVDAAAIKKLISAYDAYDTNEDFITAVERLLQNSADQ